MPNYHDIVNSQYGRANLSDQILSALVAAGKDINNLTRDDLSSFDEFHIGGRMETRALAERVPNLGPGTNLLDVGSGIGGPARTLADEFGCQVVGLDLTKEFCDAATTLTERIGLAQQVTLQHGDALDMPFDDASFDVVWMQFAGMNIQDKTKFYAQCHRVIRSGGYFAFHEVMQGPVTDVIYPVLWADAPNLSFLHRPEDIQKTLQDLGFQQETWLDLTQSSIEWWEQARAQRAKRPPQSQVGLSVFAGDNTRQRAANVMQNLQESRIIIVQAIYRK